MADVLQTVEQYGKLVALHSRDQIVMSQGWRRMSDPQRRFQSSRGRGQQAIAADWHRRIGVTRRATEIDQQQGKVEALISGGALNGLR